MFLFISSTPVRITPHVSADVFESQIESIASNWNALSNGCIHHMNQINMLLKQRARRKLRSTKTATIHLMNFISAWKRKVIIRHSLLLNVVEISCRTKLERFVFRQHDRMCREKLSSSNSEKFCNNMNLSNHFHRCYKSWRTERSRRVRKFARRNGNPDLVLKQRELASMTWDPLLVVSYHRAKTRKQIIN